MVHGLSFNGFFNSGSEALSLLISFLDVLYGYQDFSGVDFIEMGTGLDIYLILKFGSRIEIESH